MPLLAELIHIYVLVTLKIWLLRSRPWRPLKSSLEPNHFAINFTRTLRLIKESSGRCFIPDLSAHGFGGTEEGPKNKIIHKKAAKVAKT